MVWPKNPWSWSLTSAAAALPDWSWCHSGFGWAGETNETLLIICPSTHWSARWGIDRTRLLWTDLTHLLVELLLMTCQSLECGDIDANTTAHTPTHTHTLTYRVGTDHGMSQRRKTAPHLSHSVGSSSCNSTFSSSKIFWARPRSSSAYTQESSVSLRLRTLGESSAVFVCSCKQTRSGFQDNRQVNFLNIQCKTWQRFLLRGPNTNIKMCLHRCVLSAPGDIEPLFWKKKSFSCCWYEMKNKNARRIIWLDLSLCILIISLQILVGLVGVRKGGNRWWTRVSPGCRRG